MVQAGCGLCTVTQSLREVTQSDLHSRRQGLGSLWHWCSWNRLLCSVALKRHTLCDCDVPEGMQRSERADKAYFVVIVVSCAVPDSVQRSEHADKAYFV